jgi:hypothetical protein
MKMPWGKGGTAPPFLTLSLDGGECPLSNPSCLLPSPRKEPWYPSYRRLDGWQNQYIHCGEKKNVLPPSGIKPQYPGHPAHCYTSSAFWTAKLQKYLYIFKYCDVSSVC